MLHFIDAFVEILCVTHQVSDELQAAWAEAQSGDVRVLKVIIEQGQPAHSFILHPSSMLLIRVSPCLQNALSPRPLYRPKAPKAKTGTRFPPS